MFLKKIVLVNYKNFGSAEYNFDEKINCFVGDNGVGKTNILDAIYHLAFAKGYFNSVATQNIKHGEEFYLVEGIFERDKREELISCSLKRGQKKVVKRNSKVYDKLSDHIGLIPLVIISPSDTDLIIEGSDVRRKFVDSVISQSDISYLHDLITYNKVLSQRNSLLKYFALNHTYDALNISVYNEQLVLLGARIHKKRKEFLKDFIPLFNERYKYISESKEDANIEYKSHLNNKDFVSLLENTIEKDRLLQYTSVGIHKDDLLYTLDGHSVKKFGSQGQKKSYLIALRFAQFDFIKKNSKNDPILLLDDIFDKLDEKRIKKLVSLVNFDVFGQLFISDTHQERTEEVIKTTKQSYKIFKIENERDVKKK